MEKGLQGLTILVGLLMLLGGLSFVFFPTIMEPFFSVTAIQGHGMGTIRGDLGGAFLSLSAFTLYGSRPENAKWLAVPVVFLCAILFGRAVHIVLDGITNDAIRSVVIEVIGIVLLEAARRKLPNVSQGQ
jgi:hypothetical protein